MNLSRRYGEIKASLRNVNKDMALRILNVLENSGSAILKSDHLVSGGLTTKLSDILILSDQMKRSIRIFDENIRSIGSNDKMSTGSQFYIADYGGSKTQFIELIKSKIEEEKERDEPPFNRLIPVVFNGSIDLIASYLGVKIENDTARILTRQLEILQKDPQSNIDHRVFNNFMNLLLDFRKVKNAPEHLEKIHSLLSDLERISDKSTGVMMKISKIRQEFSKLPLIDEERLLNIVFDIMEFASKYNIVYLFFFDECDDWLAKIEEESKWNQNFLKRQYFFRKLYDRIQNLRLYQIYFLTPRVHEAIQSEKSDQAPGIQRIASDMIKAAPSGSYIQIREQGVYQENQAIEAVLKWLTILEKAYQKPDKEIFNSFLPKLIKKVDNRLSRRKANSTIISSIRAFIKLTEDIKNGQNQYNTAERNPSLYITIGNIIEKTFSSYLNFLNFNFEKKHHDVGGGRKIDGQFMSSKASDTEIFAEIKTFKNPHSFNINKAEQVINCVKSPDSKAIFFLFSKNLTEDFVKNKLYEWKNYGHISTDVRLENIFPIIINDQTLLNCLVGFERVPHSQLSDKLENFDKLLRLINTDFHGKLINLFPSAKPVPEEIIKAKEEIEAIGEKLPEEIAIKAKKILKQPESYSQLLRKLETYTDTSIRTAVEVVKTLGTRQKVYKRRKISTLKKHISNPLLKNSLDDAIEFLKRGHIIKERNEYINFDWDIFDDSDRKSDPEGLMIEIFKEVLKIIPENQR